MCEKIRYHSKTQAVAHAKRREKETFKFYRTYICELCGHWHLTSQVKRNKSKEFAYQKIDAIMNRWKKDNEKRNS